MSIRESIERIYADYSERNIEKVLDALADDFLFEWPYDQKVTKLSGSRRGKLEFAEQLKDLASKFEFNSFRASNIVVEGARAAAQVRVNLTSSKTGDTFNTTLLHFWFFENDIPVQLMEYMDTALISAQVD